MNQLICLIVAVAAAIGLYLLSLGLFNPTSLGGDYTFFVPRLVYGDFWVTENGLMSVPWYSPAWCGGLPFFGDAQVMFYSVPQVLIAWLEPVEVIRVTFALFGALGVVGTYLLARHLQIGVLVAVLVAAMFGLNDFYISRLEVGHFSYHVFPLIPLIAWLLCWTGENERRGLATVVAGVLIAYFVYAGAGNFVVPAMMAVFALILIVALKFPEHLPGSVLAFLQAGLIGVLLSLSKIVAVASFMEGYPREAISLGVFEDLGNAIFSILTALFLNPWITLSNLEGQNFVIESHELRFGITLVPALMLVLAMANLPRLIQALTATRALCLALLLLVLSLPILLSIQSTLIDESLKDLPYFREMSLSTRWLAILIPALLMFAALGFNSLLQSVGDAMTAKGLLGAGVLVTLMLLIATVVLRDSVVTDTYDAQAITTAHTTLRSGGSVAAISSLHDVQAKTFAGVDDGFVNGNSSLICYQPVFGYALERFPIKTLRPGSPYQRTGDHLNFKNPACYAYPEANSCQRGDHFKVDQEQALSLFLTNQPTALPQSTFQTLANWISLVSLVLVLGAVIMLSLRRLFRMSG